MCYHKPRCGAGHPVPITTFNQLDSFKWALAIESGHALSLPESESFVWPANRWQRLVVGLVALLVVGLLASTTALNWAEDLLFIPAEGALLHDLQSGTVFLYEAGHKRRILNGETLRCLQRPGQHLIRYRRLGDLPDGPAVQNREGCTGLPPAGFLVQPIGQTEVYLSTGSSLRLIPNRRRLDCLANPRPIEPVAPSYVESLPIGPPLPDGESCP